MINVNCLNCVNITFKKKLCLATAAYRLLPAIHLTKPVRDEDADLLQSCFSPGVIEVVEQETKSGAKYREARVKNARYDTCTRNVYCYEQLKNCVELTRIPNHFICKYESRNCRKEELNKV